MCKLPENRTINYLSKAGAAFLCFIYIYYIVACTTLVDFIIYGLCC